MIGIFDSGLGGLTVVKEILKVLPEYQFLYFGDTARTPYGTKGNQVVINYAIEDTELLLNKGAKLIVVACNTASAVSYEELKKKFRLPLFEVITPAVKKAVEVTKNKRIGVIGTRATVNSGIYEKLIKEIDPEIKVYHQACPLLVPLVEEGWLDKPETKTIIKKYLTILRQQQIDTLILGCTHYPLLKEIIQEKAGNQVTLIDPAEEVAKTLKDYLDNNSEIKKDLPTAGENKFYISDLKPQSQQVTEKWLGQSVKLEELKW